MTTRLAKVLSYYPRRDNISDKELSIAWLIQNKIRSTCCYGAIIVFNCILFRKFALPQFGVLVNGATRKAVIDLLPAVLFLNFQLGYRLVEVSELMDFLESESNPEGAGSTDPREADKIKKEMKLKAKYLSDSQYWH